MEYATSEGVRAKALAEVRIENTLAGLKLALDNIGQTPVPYDVKGQCLYQARDAIWQARDLVQTMQDALDAR